MDQNCSKCGAATSGFAQCPGCGTALPDVVTSESGAVISGSRREGKNRKGLALGAGALALAVGASGVLAWSVLGQKGGASSPEAAAEKFLTSLAAQDVVGVIDSVLPGEVEGLSEAWESSRSEAVAQGEMPEEGVTSAATVTADTFDFTVDEVDSAVALVSLADTDLSVEWDLDKVDGKKLKKEVDELDLDAKDRKGVWPNAEDGGFKELTAEMAKVGITPTLVTIEEDGRWYVSVLGTTQNVAFQGIHHVDDDDTYDPKTLDWATVGRGHEAIVGKDSRQVVEQIIEAVETADVEDALALLPQSQVRALWASWGHVVDAANESLGDAKGDWGLDIDVKKWETVETDQGDNLVKVGLKSAEFTATYTDDSYDPSDEYSYDGSFSGTIRYADGCFSAEMKGEEPMKSCVDELDLGRKAFEGDLLTVVMRKVEGGLQFDPLGTWVHYATTIDFEKMLEGFNPFGDLGALAELESDTEEGYETPDFTDENGEWDDAAYEEWLKEQFPDDVASFGTSEAS
ncbi:zinc ribbon domain-containing protein [Nocardioides yefusunii]|uniref:Zinc ribbon domain-containing protein n=2 Tax=Nocardioides yefusunii TaxID=2500546 RepID=A0ABW1QU46_9ACTN|nr:zinc ribbon domain-containing protein [Nocardioides yefusunii]